ncbi:sialic acid-binding Ig-like lectin 5 isoform X1 [Danio rerio]|uniref:Sialic acid-binding Ig-like lectin 5 isoform X1 n=1 Tax=Danio rerio TaxID=7955 RepID=A0AB32T5V7_DANRE
MKIISLCTIIFMLVFNVLCEENADNGWNISFSPREVTAVKGLCAHISCTFTYPVAENPIQSVIWQSCVAKDKCNLIFQNNVEKNKLKKNELGHIKMLEPDLSKNNCSIILKDIKENEKEYTFRIKAKQQYTFNPTVKISIKDEPTLVVPPLSEKVEVNLTCSAPFPCPETPPVITWWIKTKEENYIKLDNNKITQVHSEHVYYSYLTLIPTSDQHDGTVGCDVRYGNKKINTNNTLEVKYVQALQIVGENTLMEGDTLNLTCTFRSHPPASNPVWRFNGNTDNLNTQTSAGTLMIANVGKEHAGIYVCEMTYMNKTLNASITINITEVNILGENRLKKGDTLNLTCSFKNHPQSSSNPVWSFNGDADKLKNQASAANLIIDNVTKEHAGIYACEMTYMKKTLNASITVDITGVLDFLLSIPNIFTFVAGMAFSALIFSVILCCWVCCHRGKKQKVPTANPDAEINLETVQTDVAQNGTTEQTPLHEQPDGETPKTPATPTDGAEEDEALGTEAREVDYASIDYSLLKDKPPEEAETEPTDTDYAEIKKDRTKDWKDTEDPQDGDEQVETFDQKEMGAEEELYSQVPQ